MFKKSVLILCIVLPLSGCIPAILVGAAAVSGTVLYGKRTFKQRSIDSHAGQQATLKIKSDKSLSGHSHVRVNVYNGIALIVGEAVSKQVKQAVGQKVSSIKGVRRVYNELAIEGSLSALSRVSDSLISSKVRTQMLIKKGLNSADIAIVTEAGSVYLMGVITKKQGDLAASVASKVSGVRKVVKVYEYE